MLNPKFENDLLKNVESPRENNLLKILILQSEKKYSKMLKSPHSQLVNKSIEQC